MNYIYTYFILFLVGFFFRQLIKFIMLEGFDVFVVSYKLVFLDFFCRVVILFLSLFSYKLKYLFIDKILQFLFLFIFLNKKVVISRLLFFLVIGRKLFFLNKVFYFFIFLYCDFFRCFFEIEFRIFKVFGRILLWVILVINRKLLFFIVW